VIYNRARYQMRFLNPKVYMKNLSNHEDMKAPFPLDVHEIVHVEFQPERNRLKLYCYLSLRKVEHGDLELVVLNFKCLDECGLVNIWMNHLRTKLSGRK
jgi:hypothetical protein